MTFSTYLDLYAFFSSAALLAMVTNVYNKMYDIIRPSLGIRATRAQAQAKYSLWDPFSLLSYGYYASLEYMKVQDIADDIASDPNRQQFYEQQAEKGYHIASRIHASPEPFNYSIFMENLNKAVTSAKLKAFDQPNTQQLIDDISDLLMTLADATKRDIEEWYTDMSNADMVNDYEERGLSTEFKPEYRNGDELDDDTYALISLGFKILEDEQLPDEVIKFLLNPTIGSAGMTHIFESRSPLYVTAFPIRYLMENSKRHWDARAAKMDPKPLSPNHYHDSNQTNCEKHIFDSLGSGDHDRILNDRISGKHKGQSVPGFPGFTHTRNSGSGTPRGQSSSKGKGRKRQPSSSTPDDSTYEPDSLLASKAQEFTHLVQAKPTGTKFHDHMDRFNSTDESPRAISRSQVINGVPDSDFLVQTRIRGVKTNYVVTYSRKSRKPIFNVIT